MRFAIAIASVVALAGSASAAVRRVPQDHTTIAAAAAAAQPGDTIQVAKGRYILDATVTFSDADLIIKGSGAIIDGARPNLNNADINSFYFDSNADGCSITGFTFVNGTNAIYSDGDNITITKCTFIDTGSEAIYSNSGDTLLVSGCKFLGCDGAVYSNVANATVSKNVLRSVDNEGIQIQNNGARVESNTVNFVEGQEGIYVDGTDSFVLKNKVFNTDGEGIEVYSNDGTVSGNTVKKSDDATGVYVEGDRVKVEKNKTSDTGYGIEVYASSNLTEVTVTGNKCNDIHSDSYGIEVGADEMIVVGNTVFLGSDNSSGFYLYSYTDPAAAGPNNGLIENNKASEFMSYGFEFNSIYNVSVRNCSATNCGSEDEAGFWVNGNDNAIEGLKATGIDNTGIYHDGGNNNVYTKCAVKNVFADGYRVWGDNNDFVNCTAAGCGGEGFDNRGGVTTATELKDGKYRGDRNDVANDTANGAQITLDADVDTSTPGTPQSQVD